MTMNRSLYILFFAAIVLAAFAPSGLRAQDGPKHTPQAFEAVEESIGRLLGKEPADTPQARTMLMPWLTGLDMPMRLKLDVAATARTLAGAIEDVNEQIDLYTKAAALTESVAEGEKTPDPYRVKALVAQGRMNYEMGKIFQRKAQAEQKLETRKEYVETSDGYLQKAVVLFTKAEDTRENAEDTIWARLDALLDKYDKEDEKALPPPAQNELNAYRGALYQSLAEAKLFKGWAFFTEALNRGETAEGNPVPKRRKAFETALEELEDSEIEMATLPLAAPWIYLNKPDMLPSSPMQAQLGKAVDAFRSFVQFCGDAEIAYLGRFGMAQARFEMGRYEDALALYEGIVALGTPQKTREDASLDQVVKVSMERAAECLFEMGKTDEGVARFRKMLARYPREGDPELQIEVFRYRSLSKQLRKLKETGAPADVLRTRAEEILGKMRPALGHPETGPYLFGTAAQVIKQGGLTYPPDWPSVQFALAQTAYDGGNYSDAIRYGRRALDRIDDLPEATHRKEVAARIADVLISSYLNLAPPDYREAAEAARTAEEAAATPEEKAHFAYTRMVVWNKEYERSEREDAEAKRRYAEALRHLVETYPKTEKAQQAVFLLADNERGAAQDKQAQAEGAQAFNPERAENLRQEAADLMTRAIDYYGRVAPDSPYRLQALVMRGVTAERLGKLLRDRDMPNAEQRSKTLRKVARESYSEAADPDKTFDPQTKQLPKWRADASIRMAQLELEQGDMESLQSGQRRLEAAARVEGLEPVDEARILFLNFQIALEMSKVDEAGQVEHLDRAASLLEEYRTLEPNKRIVSYALRSFGHTLARRYRRMAHFQKKEPTPARREELLKRGPQVVSLLYNGYKAWPLPGPDETVQGPRLNLQQAMAVFKDLVFVDMQHEDFKARAHEEAVEVGRDIVSRKADMMQSMGARQYNQVLLLMAVMAIEGPNPLEADNYLSQHPLQDHPQIVELRARANMRGWDRAPEGERDDLRQRAIAAINLWSEVEEKAKSSELKYEAIYQNLRLMWELGQDDPDMRKRARERAKQIGLLYNNNYPGAAPETAANLVELTNEIPQ